MNNSQVSQNITFLLNLFQLNDNFGYRLHGKCSKQFSSVNEHLCCVVAASIAFRIDPGAAVSYVIIIKYFYEYANSLFSTRLGCAAKAEFSQIWISLHDAFGLFAVHIDARHIRYVNVEFVGDEIVLQAGFEYRLAGRDNDL